MKYVNAILQASHVDLQATLPLKHTDQLRQVSGDPLTLVSQCRHYWSSCTDSQRRTTNLCVCVGRPDTVRERRI